MNSNSNHSPETPNWGKNRLLFGPVWPWNLADDIEKQWGTSSKLLPSCLHHFITIGELKHELQSANAQFGPKLAFFVPCDHAIPRMTLKIKRAPLLRYLKLCEPFHSNRWIQTAVTVRKRLHRVKIGYYLSRPTLKFEGLQWKIITHLPFVPSSFAHHLIAICEFILELLSGNS